MQEKEDTPYEEDVVRNAYSLSSWWRYLQAKEDSAPSRRFWLFERALREMPGCYKLWYHYLRERLEALEGLPIVHPHFAQVRHTFERALAYMHKMPRIWQMFLDFLVHKSRQITLARHSFDRALASLPVTQHDLIWPSYIAFAKMPHLPPETTKRIFRRYLKIEPDEAEEYIDFLLALEVPQPGEAALLLSRLINDDGFISKKNQTRHDLWMKLCHISSKYPEQITLKVPQIIRSALAKFTHEVGKLWCALADYFARLGQFDAAHDVFEEAIASVVSVRDFGIIWDAYIEFEYSLIAAQMKRIKAAESAIAAEGADESTDDVTSKKSKKSKKSKSGKSSRSGAMGAIELQQERDSLEMRLARYDDLLSRQKLLISDVILRQNPHNVAEWRNRIQLFEDSPKLQVAEFTSALATIDPLKAIGKPQSIWIGFARFWEDHGQVAGARQVFSKAVQVRFKTVHQLTEVWLAYVEMELRVADEAEEGDDISEEVKRARALIQQATAVPPNHKLVERQIKNERRINGANKAAAKVSNTGRNAKYGMDGDDDSESPIGSTLTPQDKLFRQIKLWSLYADIEESYGTFDSTKAVYEKMYELKVATPLTVLNYAAFLEENHRFEESFRAYERGIDMFPYPHALDIWVTYLNKFLQRYGSTKLERARDLFEQSVEHVTPECARVLYLMYAQFEEEHGLARHTMHIYDRATRAVPEDQRAGIFNIYIRKAAKFFGITRTREVFERALDAVPDSAVRDLCVRYAKLETSLGEYNRARSIQAHCAQFCDPRSDVEFWRHWKAFEEAHGNTETFKEMLRIRRSVIAQYNSIVNTSQSANLLARAKELQAAEEASKRSKNGNDQSNLNKPASNTSTSNKQNARDGARSTNIGDSARANANEGRGGANGSSNTSDQAQVQHVAPENEDEINLDDYDDDNFASGNGPEGDGEEEGNEAPKLTTKFIPDAVFGGFKSSATDSAAGEDVTEAGTKKRKRE